MGRDLGHGATWPEGREWLVVLTWAEQRLVGATSCPLGSTDVGTNGVIIEVSATGLGS